MRQHLKELAFNGTKILKKRKKINVLDIGCNDGTLLNFYPKNFEKYGIDPSQIIKKINKKKIFTIQDYFPLKKNQKKLLNKKFDIITSIAMFYDLENPNLFVNKIKKYLSEKGFWIFELSYLVDMLKLNSFDTICHEHLEYYSLSSLEYLMKKHNLKIFKVSRNKINGGSIRCFVTHKDNFIYDKKNNYKLYNSLLLAEKKLKIKNKYIYTKFVLSINNIKKKILYKINSILKNKETIYILGASTKGNTILQFLGIDNKIIPYAIERNKEKIGAKTIGSNIKIVSEKFAKQKEPDYKLVLPWHFKKEIIEREIDYLKKGGNLIFPLPNLSLVNFKNYRKYVK
tara:strand:+ start:35 stop:1060 length:1026 start_codon:yes stop_codon:yes gene_type:complete